METRIIAHRGYHKTCEENTLAAFSEALEAGADGLELDVHLTKDGELVVFHDFELEHLTGHKGMISQYAMSELRNMRIRGSGIIPSLEEVLLLFKAFKVKHPKRKLILNVELKAGSQLYPRIEEKTVNLCRQYLEEEEVIYSSFDHDALYQIKNLVPGALTGILTASSLFQPWDYMKGVGSSYYHPHYMSLTEDKLKALIARGIRLNPYTVNDPAVAKVLIQAGVHAIITDETEMMLKLKKEVER